MFVASRLRELIEKEGITQVKFSEDTKVKKTSLFAYLTGTSKPGADTLEIIADYFKVPIDYFFDRQIDMGDVHIGHNITGNGNKVGNIELNECRTELNHINELLMQKDEIIKQKDALIAEKERTIQLLINK